MPKIQQLKEKLDQPKFYMKKPNFVGKKFWSLFDEKNSEAKNLETGKNSENQNFYDRS